MKEKEADKYVYLCIAVALILLSTLFFQPNIKEDTTENTGILGITYDVRVSAKGYTFSFEDVKGETTRCFSYDEPDEDTIYVVKGNVFEDGSMFFVKDMQRMDG
jgi:hypothetical protein